MKTRIIKSLCVMLMLASVTYNSTIYSMATGNDGTTGTEEKSNDNKDGESEGDTDIEALQQSIQEKQTELQKLQSEKSTIQSSKSSAEAIIKGLQASKNEVSSYITEMDAELAAIQANIDDLNSQIDQKTADIELTKQELAVAEETERAQYAAMKERIRFMYESGDSLYFDLFFSAESFGDMLNKAEYIEQLSAYDRKMLEEYKLTVELTQACKDELEAEEAVLEEAKTTAEEEEETMNVLIAEKEAQLAVYETDIANKQAAIDEYDAELKAKAEVIGAIEAVIAAEREQLAEANRIKYDGGMFTWPAPQYVRISSEFGNRPHPTLGVTKFHEGLDMAAPGGSPILAAYYGKVVAASYTSVMGNYIIIDHGDSLYTIYMHASALYVSKDEYVTAGQKIAAVGSTGRSTGNHLHFGVRLNGNYVNPWDYL